MKTFICILLSIVSCYCYPQDSIKVSSYGSMADFPFYSTQKSNQFHWEFRHFQQNTILKITLWDFKENIQNTKENVIFCETLKIKENSRADVTIQQKKDGKFDICCSLAGKFMSVHPLKTDTHFTLHLIKSLPKIKERVIPIMLFVENEDNIDGSLLEAITNLPAMEIEKDEVLLTELLSQSPSFKILTYQLLTEK